MSGWNSEAQICGSDADAERICEDCGVEALFIKDDRWTCPECGPQNPVDGGRGHSTDVNSIVREQYRTADENGTLDDDLRERFGGGED